MQGTASPVTGASQRGVGGRAHLSAVPIPSPRSTCGRRPSIGGAARLPSPWRRSLTIQHPTTAINGKHKHARMELLAGRARHKVPIPSSGFRRRIEATGDPTLYRIENGVPESVPNSAILTSRNCSNFTKSQIAAGSCFSNGQPVMKGLGVRVSRRALKKAPLRRVSRKPLAAGLS
jgi:hypothetical protein